MPQNPDNYDIKAHVYIRKGDPLADFIISNMRPGEQPGHTIKRLLGELMVIKWFEQSSRRIKRNIKKQLKMRARK